MTSHVTLKRQSVILGGRRKDNSDNIKWKGHRTSQADTHEVGLQKIFDSQQK